VLDGVTVVVTSELEKLNINELGTGKAVAWLGSVVAPVLLAKN